MNVTLKGEEKRKDGNNWFNRSTNHGQKDKVLLFTMV